MSKSIKPRIGITLGDCAGIGPEIVDLALKCDSIARCAEYKIIGKYPDCPPGHPTQETARAAAAALEEAVTLARRGELDAIVTGPIHKARMYEVGFRFPGQTEFFAERCGIKNFAMCLTGGKITVALVTVHLPLRKVSCALKQSEIVRVGLLLADFLYSRSRTAPRIAVAGLNPHAGESGKLGQEEIEIISPAVSELQSAIRNPQSAIFSISAAAWQPIASARPMWPTPSPVLALTLTAPASTPSSSARLLRIV